MAHVSRFNTLLVIGLTTLLLAACSNAGTSDDEPESSKQSPSGSLPADPGSGLAAANDDGAIEVGIPYTANGEEANANAGAGAITRNDEASAAKAVIDDINAQGGIAGRKIKPVFFGYNATSSETRASQDQAACSHFTEDNNIAVLLGGGLTDNFDACMLEAGVLVLNSGSLLGPDDAHFAKYPNLYDAGTVSQDRMMADMVDSLERQDYFNGWDAREGKEGDGDPVVAVLTTDEPEWDRPLHGVLLPALEEAGHPVDDSLVIAIPSAATEAELGQASKSVQNAVLKLTTAGATHLVMLDSSGTMTLLFGQAAAQQGFFPRLGVNSATGLQALYDAGVLKAPQLAGAIGLGWLPTLDLPASEGEQYTTEAASACLDTVQAATGQAFTSTNAAGLALSKCDMGHLMTATLGGIEGDWTLQSAADALADLGDDDYQSALLPGSGFAGGRHDAVQVGYDMTWDAECGCVTYQDEHEIP
jgi:ABC-type branched-subunit amino acid transport system substrate-binding protein